MRKLLLTLAFVLLPIAAKAATIPFVACPVDMRGPGEELTPTGRPLTVDLPTVIAGKLALYAGAHQAVLAPRSWTCTAGIGSDAAGLIITPPAGSPHAKGAAITISFDASGTGSAIADVMTIGRTYFPNLVSAAQYADFLKSWTGVGQGAPPAPRYPTDRIKYLSPSMLEYETPPGKNGIGQLTTFGSSVFAQSGIISLEGKYVPPTVENGVPMNGEDDRGINALNVSLPPDLANLTPYILAASRLCMGDDSCALTDDIDYPTP
jgi:hypothetical protein